MKTRKSRERPEITDPKESILLVDDEEAIRCILNKGLSVHGYSCDEAGDGEKALEKLEGNSTDLVIMDINMPGRPGSEILPEMTVRFPETAVIMASGITDSKVIAKCIKDGAHDYICKPFRFEQVLRSVSSTLDKRRLAVEIQKYFREAGRESDQFVEFRNFFTDNVEALVNNLEASDDYTRGHSEAVTKIALTIGSQLGLSEKKLNDLKWASLLHDVGKIAVDPDILNKPGELTSSEYRHIMTHAVIGPSLVKPFVNNNVVDIISHHHDHYDGSGFNQSIKGKSIPLGARIIAVADAYQAMISDRPYRRAMSQQDAIEELLWYSGSQFDPIIANMLIDNVRQSNCKSRLKSFGLGE
jgi:putative two-component system response regulator